MRMDGGNRREFLLHTAVATSVAAQHAWTPGPT